MSERIYLQLFHSDVPGAVPSGLKIGELGINVADNIQFYGYGGDINYDVNGDPLPVLPPPGMGWRATGIGGDGPPGPPGPAGEGVPVGGLPGQVLTKLSGSNYDTEWADPQGGDAATPFDLGSVYAYTPNPLLGTKDSVALGYGALHSEASGDNSVAIGSYAGYLSDNAINNVFVGNKAGYNADGNNNVIVGIEALGGTGGSGTGNVLLGYQTAYNATSANYNTLVGYRAGFNIRGGDNNTIIGSYGGSSNLQGNVVLADGQGNIRFQANEFGAWNVDGSYGTSGQILMSQGLTEPPMWAPAPGAGVTQVVPGNGILVSPSSGTGVVTVSFDGDPNAGVQSITSGQGVTFRNAQGQVVSSITTSGSIEINSNQVLTPALYTEAGSILIGGFAGLTATGVVSLLPGNPGQVLTISGSGFPSWQDAALTPAATPSTRGTVFARTDGSANPNVALGLGAGSAITGSALGNTFIGPSAGSQVNTGDYNTFVGGYVGSSNISNNIVLSDGQGNIKLQLNENGALSVDGTNYGSSGYVLSSNGPGMPPQWVDPPNAPIQTISGGNGIDITQIGTAVEVINTGVTNIVATSPLQVSDNTGDITISAPNVLTTLSQGAGITVTGTGNSRTIANTGVVTLQNGANTTAVQVSPGVWKIDAASGGGGTLTGLLEGAGIDITNPSGPTPTITNSGVISVAANSKVVPSATTGTGITFNLQNVVFGVTAGSGITLGGTAENPTISNSGVISLQNGAGTTVQNVGNGVWQVNATGTAGVTKIIAGTNVSISPTTGTGEVTISAAGGGGGGSITTIAGGPGISIASPTGPTVTVNNTGVLSVAGTTGNITATTNAGAITLDIGSNVLTNVSAGSGITVSGTGNTRTIANAGVTSLTAGTGISLSGGTGNVTISATNSSGTVKEITSSNAFLGVQNGTGPTVTLTNLGVNTLTAGTGITLGGTAQNPTVGISSSVLTSVTAGNGISVTGTGNTRAIANTGVVSLVNGSGITATQGTNGAWTVANTGVTKIVAGANVTVSGDGTGTVTIASSGGGGGSGTVTSITAGNGLTGGTITTSGRIDVDPSYVLTKNSFGNSGSLVYWYRGIQALNGRFDHLDCPATDIGQGYYFLGVTDDLNGTPTWRVTYCTDLRDGDGTKAAPGGVFVNKGEFAVDLNWTTISGKYVDYTRYDTKGSLLIGSGTGTVGTSARATTLPVGTEGQILSVGAGSAVTWTTPTYNAYAAGTGITIDTGTRVGTTQNYTVSLNTTYLNSNYIPKSFYTATGALVQGTGVGTYATLPPGSNGQILSVSPTGSLQWINNTTPGGLVNTVTGVAPISITGTAADPIVNFDVNTSLLTKYIKLDVVTAAESLIVGNGPGTVKSLPKGAENQVLTVNGGVLKWVTPASPVSITAADDTIICTPSPITGTGTIKVNPNKFMNNPMNRKGDMIYGADELIPSTPGRLAIGVAGTILTVVDGVPAWVDTINGGSY